MVDPIDGVDAQFLKEIEKVDNDNDKNSSSSSDSEIHNYTMLQSAGKNRLFGRQKPLHMILGGGKPADIILWRNKQISASIFASATVIWLVFECAGYHLLTFVCHSLILLLAALFLWSNFASFINVSPPEFSKFILPEEVLVTILLSLRNEINRAFIIFREVASGKDTKKFLSVIAALWFLSVVSSWFSFLTLFYLVFVMLQTVLMLYEKNEDVVDTYAQRAFVEIKKQYAVVDERVLQKLPILATTKDHKQH